MGNQLLIKNIYRKIKKYDTIVIARHIGADPDALSSQIALRDIILNTFPKKKVYAVGTPASAFKYLGMLDRFDEEMYQNSLLICLDVPDAGRVDGVDVKLFKDSIKIDHHPFVEKYCEVEWIDDTASSACQLVMELVFNTKLKLTKSAAEKLYIGLVSDTNRFLFYYTTPKTFDLVSKLIKVTKIDFTSLYEPLYLRPIKEVKFQGFLISQLKITENGFGYAIVTDEMLKEYEVDAATAGNMVNKFNYIEGVLSWAIFSVDTKNDNIRGSIRSRGPVINEVAAKFGGGGHKFASGVRLKTLEDVEEMVKKLDETCKEYNNKES